MLLDMKDLKNELKQIRIKQKECNEELKELKRESNMLKEENKIFKKNIEIKTELKETTKSVEILEKEKRLNNVVVTGLKVDTSNSLALKEAMNDFVKQHLEVEPKLKTFRKLGPRTYLMEMINTYEKKLGKINRS
ncbi:hypothetical protein ILUMI_18532 [Ignelater luminosus]|uniref:Uncharacterized protein n=1 Tax=Ignelater luminosus TaxID=2038154 RepID=A0A8K0CLX2_IGNLU|nr:hypothetical protein ILUMI_18532 [Ignelater luminosus]